MGTVNTKVVKHSKDYRTIVEQNNNRIVITLQKRGRSFFGIPSYFTKRTLVCEMGKIERDKPFYPMVEVYGPYHKFEYWESSEFDLSEAIQKNYDKYLDELYDFEQLKEAACRKINKLQ